MSFLPLNLLLNVSLDASRLTAEAMVGSFISAAILIVVPATIALIWVSQKDQLNRSR